MILKYHPSSFLELVCALFKYFSSPPPLFQSHLISLSACSFAHSFPDVADCKATFKSYDEATDSYMNTDGYRQKCKL